MRKIYMHFRVEEGSQFCHSMICMNLVGTRKCALPRLKHTYAYNNQDTYIYYCMLTWKLHVEHNESYLSACLASLALNTPQSKVDVVSKGAKRIQGQVSN